MVDADRSDDKYIQKYIADSDAVFSFKVIIEN